MKASRLSVFSLVMLWSASALAQDAVKVDPTHYKVIVDNASVRVLRISYPAGAKSVMHQHPDTLVIPLLASQMRFTLPDGKAEDMSLAGESATFAPAGTHNPANVGKGPLDAILIEFKAAAPGKGTMPATRDSMTMKVLAESPRAVAYRVTAEPGFQEPAGTKHDFDQVVIALGPSEMSLAVDGRDPKTEWTRGDVAFIARGATHESKHTGPKPVDFIIVGVK